MEQYWTRTKIHVCYLAGQNVYNKVVLDWTEIHLSYHANRGVHHEPVLEPHDSLSNIHFLTVSLPWEVGVLLPCGRAGVRLPK